MAKTVTTNQLNPGDVFVIRGNVIHSRIASRIEGTELEEENKREIQRGRLSNDNLKPYTRLSVCNARVELVTPGATAQLLQTYANESFYVSTVAAYTGNNFQGRNKSPFSLPWVCVDTGNNNEVVKIDKLEGELDAGLDVSLYMRVFATKSKTASNGVALEGVIVHEPIRYRTAAVGDPSGLLGAFGIKMIRDSAAPTASGTPAQAPRTAAPMQQPQATGYQPQQPQAGTMPAPAPGQNVYSSQPGYAAQQPRAQPQPGYQAQQPQAPAGYPGGPFAGPAPSGQPSDPGAGGVLYNPAQRQY